MFSSIRWNLSCLERTLSSDIWRCGWAVQRCERAPGGQRARGRGRNTELLDDLNVKRSSFVIALLAELSDVVVRSIEPIVVELISASAT
jgi:hypothetical protein